MKYLGIDYGEKRIGIAISDLQGSIAFPKMVLENDTHTVSRIVEIVDREDIGMIVVGDTRAFGDFKNPITAEVEAFIASLEVKVSAKVERGWEAGSSIEASRYVEGKRDDAAAAIILQRYLDMRVRSDGPSPGHE